MMIEPSKIELPDSRIVTTFCNAKTKKLFDAEVWLNNRNQAE
jgi:hypothetical protein